MQLFRNQAVASSLEKFKLILNHSSSKLLRLDLELPTASCAYEWL